MGLKRIFDIEGFDTLGGLVKVIDSPFDKEDEEIQGVADSNCPGNLGVTHYIAIRQENNVFNIDYCKKQGSI
ncbi:MAG: hypothetical protein KKB21_02135 [Nanoarchaeota archaeon]|nr:hypothetical protein [Nanoarchaeota archaeon]MBU4086354.1 hypothetical protein [Nanoarchaeota archaeon]